MRPIIFVPIFICLIGFVLLANSSDSSEILFSGLLFFIGLVGTIGIIVQDNNRKNRHERSVASLSSTHGTARAAKKEDVAHLAQSKEGLYIGAKNYFYKNQGHIITIAGARSGKGTNLIIPNLLGASDYSGSWVVIDPKGEITAITADYQAKQNKQVIILDPFQELKKQAELNNGFEHLNDLKLGTFNPLDVLDPTSDEVVDDIEVIAEMIIPLSSGTESHWDDRARSLISGLLLYMMTSKPKNERTLFKLYEWLRLPKIDWMVIVQDMQRSDAMHGIVRAQGNDIMALMEEGEKELSGILSTAKRYTDIFKSPGLIRSMSESSFDINRIAQDQMTLYLILPSDKLESHRTWLRLCIRMGITAVMRNKGHRVTFLMDEFHSLGHLKVIEKSMGRLPGYNITLWPILQDLNQLKSLYKDSWETFIANSRVRHFFGIGDNFTAKYVSEKSGDTTIVTWNTSPEGNSTYGANKRPLLTPDEVSKSKSIFTFIDGIPIASFKKFPYYNWSELQERSQPNPYFRR